MLAFLLVPSVPWLWKRKGKTQIVCSLHIDTYTQLPSSTAGQMRECHIQEAFDFLTNNGMKLGQMGRHEANVTKAQASVNVMFPFNLQSLQATCARVVKTFVAGSDDPNPKPIPSNSELPANQSLGSTSLSAVMQACKPTHTSTQRTRVESIHHNLLCKVRITSRSTPHP